MPVSPTARSLNYLRRQGWLAASVEQWIPKVERKRDLFGIGDILAIHPRDKTVALLQVTTAGHVPDRLRRIQGRPELPFLLRAGIVVEVWGWSAAGLKRVMVRAQDLTPVLLEKPPRRGRQRQRTFFDSPGE